MDRISTGKGVIELFADSKGASERHVAREEKDRKSIGIDYKDRMMGRVGRPEERIRDIDEAYRTLSGVLHRMDASAIDAHSGLNTQRVHELLAE